MTTYYYNEANSETSTTSSSDQTKVTLTFTPAETADYLFIATASIGSNSTSVACIAKFNVAGTQYGGARYYDPVSNGMRGSLACVRRLNLTGSTQYSATITFAAATNGTTVYINSARIIAIKMNGNEKYGNLYDTRQTYTGDATYQDAATTGSFTLGASGDYILIATATLDESSTSYSMMAQVVDVDSSTTHISSRIEPAAAASRYCFGVMRKITLDTNQHTFKIQYATSNGASGRTVGIQYSNIVLIPAAVFAQVNYNELEASASPAQANNWYTRATTTYTATANDYLLLGSTNMDSDNTSTGDVSCKIVSTGFDTDPEQGAIDVIDHDTADVWSYLFMRKITNTAGSKTTSLSYGGGQTTADVLNNRVSALSLAATADTRTATRDIAYAVKATTTATRDILYRVKVLNKTATRDIGYDVAAVGTNTATRTIAYAVKVQNKTATRNILYRIGTYNNTATRDIAYKVKTTPYITRTIGYQIFGQSSVQRKVTRSIHYHINGQNPEQFTDRTYTGTDVVVGLVDSGIKASHPDFEGKEIVWRDFTNANAQSPVDDIGHGSWVASILCGNGKPESAVAEMKMTGCAPGISKLVVARVQSDAEPGTSQHEIWGGTLGIAKMVNAIEWCIEQGAQVINCSLGDYTDNSTWDSEADHAANTHNVTIVAACGNGGPTAQTIACIADALYAIAVGSCNQAANQVSTFSSRGSHDTRTLPHVVAVGEIIVGAKGNDYIGNSVDTNYCYSNGTSCASPQVTALAAMIIQKAKATCPDRTLTFTEIRNIITSTATGIGTVPNNDTGYGVINVTAALGKVPTTKSVTRDIAYKVKATKTATRDIGYSVYVPSQTYTTTRDIGYKVKVLNKTVMRDIAYKVKATTTATRDILYAVKAQKTATRNILYAVKATATATRDILYRVKVLNRTATKDILYAVKATKTVTRDIGYAIPGVETNTTTRDIGYKVKVLNKTATKDILYAVKVQNKTATRDILYRVKVLSKTATRDIAHAVKATKTVTRDIAYNIAGQGVTTYTATRNILYAVKAQKTATRDITHAVKVQNKTATRDIAHAVKVQNKTAIREIGYAIFGQNITTRTATRNIAYVVKATKTATRDILYRVKVQNRTATKDIGYAVKTANRTAARNILYAVKATATVTRDILYAVKTADHTAVRDVGYKVEIADKTTTRDIEYDIVREITRSLEYAVYNPNIYYESLIGNSIITLLLTGDSTIANTESGGSTITTVVSPSSPL